MWCLPIRTARSFDASSLLLAVYRVSRGFLHRGKHLRGEIFRILCASTQRRQGRCPSCRAGLFYTRHECIRLGRQAEDGTTSVLGH